MKETDHYERIFGTNLLAVLEFYIGHDRRTLLIVEKGRFSDLRALKNVNGKMPMILTRSELVDGSDVFPLEYLTIKKTYTIRYGTDLIKNLKISKKNVRRALEFEFRSKLIHLRYEFLQLSGKSKMLRILNNAVPVMVPIFHGLLFLKGDEERYSDFSEYLDHLSKHYSTDLSIFRKIKTNKINKAGIEREIERLMQVLYELCDSVDSMRV